MIYVIVLFILVLLALICSRCTIAGHSIGAERFAVITGVMLLILSACRSQSVASDYLTNYIHMVEVRSMTWHEVFTYSSSILNQVLRKVISLLFESPQWYFFFAALLIIGVFMWFVCKFSCNVYLSVILFYTIFIYFDSHNVTRQCIAVAITLVASNYIIEQKFIKYCLIMICAVLFHSSAIFFFPMYFLASIRFTRRTLIWYFLVTAIVVITQNFLFAYVQRFLFSNYVGNSYGTGTSNIFRLIVPAVCAFTMMFFYSDRHAYMELNSEDKNQLVFNNYINHGTFLYVLCSILSYTKMLMMSRVSLFFMGPTILILCYSSSNRSVKSNIMKMVIYAMAICWFIVLLIYKKLIPYEVFW